MSRKLLLVFSTLLLTACATTTKSYNVPFVDVEETIELSTGLSRADVVAIMGKPLYSEFGDSKTGQIFWIYDVRTKNVKSGMDVNMQPVPNKTHKTHRPSDPIHKLKLEFRNDRLYRWAPMDEPKETEESNQSEESEEQTEYTESSNNKSVELPKKKSKGTFFFQPQIAQYSIKEGNCGDEWDHCNSTSALYYGGFFGMRYESGTKIGVSITGEIPTESETEIYIDDGYGYYDYESERSGGISVMAQYEKPNFTSQMLVLTIGLGFTGHDWGGNAHEDGYGDAFGFGKVSIGKKFNIGSKKIIPQLDVILGAGSYKGISLGLEL